MTIKENIMKSMSYVLFSSKNIKHMFSVAVALRIT